MTTAAEPTLADAPMRQARNSAAFWAATGRSRGHEVIERRAFLAVRGDERAGLRVLIQEPDLTADELAEITDLATAAKGPVDAEDPYSVTDLTHLGMRHWQMPIMLRTAAPAAAPALDVTAVRAAEDLHAAEQAVIEAFELDRFTPHRPGELFPLALLDEPGVDVYVARVDGGVAAACVAVVANGYGSHYWVGSPTAHRSRGAGRAVMLGSLAGMGADVPMTLTSSRLGRPLYESLGYVAGSMSTWWSGQ